MVLCVFISFWRYFHMCVPYDIKDYWIIRYWVVMEVKNSLL